jgi:hypothetical protein
MGVYIVSTPEVSSHSIGKDLATAAIRFVNNGSVFILWEARNFRIPFGGPTRVLSLTRAIWSTKRPISASLRLTKVAWISLPPSSSHLMMQKSTSRFEICSLTTKVNSSPGWLTICVLICEAFQKKKVLDDSGLKEWLGDRSTLDPLTSTPIGDLATKRDPKCRFM